MSGEKKLWQLPTPFRRFPRKQDLPLRVKASHSGSRVSSVYLSDDTSTSGFVVVPEFDDPVRTEATHEKSNHTPHQLNPPAVTSSHSLSPNGIHGYLYGLEPIGSQYSSYLGGGPRGTSVVRDDDLTQRLGSAYEHIRSMPSAASHEVSLSLDPQMLRKQLGVPQHSVLNYPIHTSLDLPNPHTFPREATSPRLPPVTSPDVPHARTLVGPQPSVSNSPTLAKRRAEKPIVSPSSLPSSRRRALKSDLRKPAANTLPSNNAPRWQNSLPQIRSPSPLKVDIPLHHTWHDRRTDFNSPREYHSKIAQFQERKLRRTSGSTDVLASLAWIGTPPMTSSPYTASRGRQPASPAFLPDRLSMAIAVEDDSISDDVLINQLEKVRKIGGPSERGKDISPSKSPGNARAHSCLSSPPPTPEQPGTPRDVPLPFPLSSKDTASDSDDTAVWQAARKTLLCIREIVRTEKKYQEALKMLLNAQTATPPPPSMTPLVTALVRVSEMLLKCFLEDPSAWGVSTAFVTSEDELEATMVSWCAVAGGFFTDENDSQTSGLASKWRLRKSGMISSPSSPSVTKQTSISFTPQLPPMFSMTTTTGKTTERIDEQYRIGQHPQAEQERQIIPVSLQIPESRIMPGQPPSRKLSVRDLAIQPIQRVMRYVLLYRDLLDCTPPTSPSRLLVERALEAAARIANHCDRAQRNPAFCHVS